MKAAVFQGVKSIKLTERPDPQIAPGEAIVKVKYCGICGTDVHSYLVPGRRSTDMVLGHEVVGTVEAIGEGVEDWKKGDRVVVGPPGSCGECYYCRHGHTNTCSYALSRTVGISAGVDGGMAEYVRVRYPRNMLYRIPDEVSFEDAVLIDTIAVAFRGVRRSHFGLGDNVVVTGAGSIGLSAIQFLRIGGARQIAALEPSPEKRGFALKFGASVCMDPVEEGEALPGKIKELYGDVGADIAFECAGSTQAFQSILNLVKCDGQVMIIGVTGEPAGISEQQIVRMEREIKGTFVYTEDDILLCLDFLAQRRFNTEGMVSDIISLDDIVEKGFERLAATPSLIKIIVAP